MLGLVASQQSRLVAAGLRRGSFILPVINNAWVFATIAAARRLECAVLLVPNGAEKLMELCEIEGTVSCIANIDANDGQIKVVGECKDPAWTKYFRGGGCGVFTSGSTSFPKLVAYDWHACDLQAEATSRQCFSKARGHSLRFIAASNVGHAYNLNGAMAALHSNATLCLPSNSKELIECISNTVEDSIIIFSTPRMYQSLLEEASVTGIECSGSVIYAFSAGCNLPDHINRRVSELLGVARVKQNYGSSETGNIALEDMNNDILVPWSDLEIEPVNQGILLPEEGLGEICIKNSSWISKGYIKQGVLQPHAQFYRTGDAGKLIGNSLESVQRIRDPLIVQRDGMRLIVQPYEFENAFLKVNDVENVVAIQGDRNTLLVAVSCDSKKTLKPVPGILQPDSVIRMDTLPTSPAGKILYSHIHRHFLQVKG